MVSIQRKIIVVTSCTGEKQDAPFQLTQDDFRLDIEQFHTRERELGDYLHIAETMYTGQQHVRLMRGIETLRKSDCYDIDLRIVSAGYGLIAGDTTIAPYECTFQTMKMREIVEWSNHLGIPSAAREVFQEPADLILVALGEQYLSALQLDQKMTFAAPTIFFASAGSAKRIPSGVRIVPLMNEHAKRFRCGMVGLKGELIGRILRHLATDGETFWDALLDEHNNLFALLDEPAPPKAVKPKPIDRRERVNHLIRLPDGWRAHINQKDLRFFIPDWDDMVDPDYDFVTDTHRGVSGTWWNQVFAHQMFEDQQGYNAPNYDGLLVSRAVAEKPQRKRALIDEVGGIHNYLRVPKDFPVLGDCGAFSYLLQDEPPYSTDELLDYYTDLGFDFGVSADHLLFGAPDEEGQQRRYDITMRNAEAFIDGWKARKPNWTPVGALQGMNPKQYAEAAAKYVQWGYTYLGIGGQVRSKTPYILEIAHAIRAVVPPSTRLHLFGVARLDSLNQFINAGITSVDSASYLRQAWMRMGQNYIGKNGLYAAIRVPEVERRIRQGVSGEEADRLRRLEAEALASLRALDANQCSVDACLNAVLDYKTAIGTKFPTSVVPEYQATLEDRPWEDCGCEICRDARIEVLIFRRNNRNRRRGFHNNYMFYHLMDKTIASGRLEYNWRSVKTTNQLQLPTFDE
jgi:hypothetical protein